jgi:hypothetical protein
MVLYNKSGWLESVGEHPMHANERMFLHAQSQDIQLENMEKVVRTLSFASFLGQIGNEEHMDHVNSFEWKVRDSIRTSSSFNTRKKTRLKTLVSGIFLSYLI